jgi:hypothetical protein
MPTCARVAGLCAFLCLSICNTADCQEIVSAEPLTKSEIIATLPVLAFRKIPVDKVIELKTPLDDWRMDEKVVAGLVVSTDEKRLSPDYASVILKQSYEEKSAIVLSEQPQFSSQGDIARKSKLNELIEPDDDVAGRVTSNDGVAGRIISVVPRTGTKPLQIDPEAIKYIMAINKGIKHKYVGDSSPIRNLPAWTYQLLRLFC